MLVAYAQQSVLIAAIQKQNACQDPEEKAAWVSTSGLNLIFSNFLKRQAALRAAFGESGETDLML